MTGLQLISLERGRQINKKGNTKLHDQKHDKEELALAAATYALPHREYHVKRHFFARSVKFVKIFFWPFKWVEFKPTPEDRIKELAKAGALCAAEIDRLQAAQSVNSYLAKNAA